MKKIKVLGLLMVLALGVSMTGCGSKEPEKETEKEEEKEEEKEDEKEPTETTRSHRSGQDDGGDWRTWTDFKVLSWETPDYFEDLYFAIYDQEITVVHDYDDYTEMCVLDIGGICDLNTVWDSMAVYDYDGDGWDDFSVSDYNNGLYYDYVFIYYPNLDEFVLDEDYSFLDGYEADGGVSGGGDSGTGSANYGNTAYEEAYIPIIDKYDRDFDFCHYYLYNINEDYDDIIELIIEYGDDRNFEVWTVGLDEDSNFVPVYVGDLTGSADYAYVTYDAYDGDNYDGMLTVNVVALGSRRLYAYTLDENNNLHEEEVYEITENDSANYDELDGIMLDRYDLSDVSPLSQIDIRY